MKVINIDNNIKISNDNDLVIIAGPCQAENLDHSLMMAENLKKICDNNGFKLIYKTSFDKANRTSANSKRGVGINKIKEIFTEIKNNFNLPIITDIHERDQASEIADYVDILQIPAFLCRQTDLLKAAAETNKIVNIKKGQFLSPNDVNAIIKKMEFFNNDKILLTERGSTFGYNNLVVDMRSLAIMSKTSYPVIFDATHSVQIPGGYGNSSGGNREFISTLAKAAVATKIAGLFMEVHQDPDKAPSDGPSMLQLDNLDELLSIIKKIDQIVKNNNL